MAYLAASLLRTVFCLGAGDAACTSGAGSCPRQARLPKLNFQILRRTFATLAVGERKGTLKDVQKQLRHARPDTTLENYVKEIPDSVYRMVDAMYEGIAGSEGALAAVSPVGGVQ
jgi:hypothetical protein